MADDEGEEGGGDDEEEEDKERGEKTQQQHNLQEQQQGQDQQQQQQQPLTGFSSGEDEDDMTDRSLETDPAAASKRNNTIKTMVEIHAVPGLREHQCLPDLISSNRPQQQQQQSGSRRRSGEELDAISVVSSVGAEMVRSSSMSLHDGDSDFLAMCDFVERGDDEKGFVRRASSTASGTLRPEGDFFSSMSRQPSPCPSEISSIIGPEKEQVLGERMRNIVTQFRSRADKLKRRLQHPPTPDESVVTAVAINMDNGNNNGGGGGFDLRSPDDVAVSARTSAAGSSFNRRFFVEDFDTGLYASRSTITSGPEAWTLSGIRRRFDYVDPRGYLNIVWLSFQAVAFLYNAWVIPLRYFFPFTQDGARLFFWLFLDYLFDSLYLLDLCLFKHRLMFMEDGFWVQDRPRITRHYVRQRIFWYDLVSVLPTDILYAWLGLRCTIVRLPRMAKVVSYWEFIYRLDAVMSKPYILRIFRTVNYMLYLIHLNACAYYFISDLEGIGSNEFVYDGLGNAYIRYPHCCC